MNINLDKKSLIILILLVLVMILGIKSYIDGDDKSEYKSKIKEFRDENLKLKQNRDSLNNENIRLISNLQELTERDSILSIQIYSIGIELDKYRKESEKSTKELNDIKRKLKDANDKIEDLINNPPEKTEEELLESIKNKLKK